MDQVYPLRKDVDFYLRARFRQATSWLDAYFQDVVFRPWGIIGYVAVIQIIQTAIVG